MSTYETRLSGREEIAEGTMAFHFERPPGFDFKAGQAVDLILPSLSGADAQDSRHAFSLVTAPHESGLTIATRMRDSPFKRALGALTVGAPIEVDGPFGSLTLHNKQTRPAVFIAGGIGITPFVSMLRHAARERLPHRFALIYSNRRPEDAAFLAELLALEGQMESFQLLATMTDMDKSVRSWTGGTGTVDAGMLERTAVALPGAIFYLAGPPQMVEAMRNLLGIAGIDDDDVRSEEFYGY